MNHDILIEILSYLPLKDKLNSALVCKEWYDVQKYIYKKQIVDVSVKILNSNVYQKWFDKYKPFIRLDESTNIYTTPQKYT